MENWGARWRGGGDWVAQGDARTASYGDNSEFGRFAGCLRSIPFPEIL